MYNEFLQLTGLIKISETNQIVLMIALSIGCTILGFVTDNLLRSSGFGPVGNTLLLLIGFAASAMLFNKYAPLYRMATPVNFIMTIGIAPLMLLLVMAFAKRLVARV